MLCGPLDKDIKDRRRKVFDDQQQLSLGHLGQVTNEGKPFFRSIKIHQVAVDGRGFCLEIRSIPSKTCPLKTAFINLEDCSCSANFEHDD